MCLGYANGSDSPDAKHQDKLFLFNLIEDSPQERSYLVIRSYDNITLS